MIPSASARAAAMLAAAAALVVASPAVPASARPDGAVASAAAATAAPVVRAAARPVAYPGNAVVDYQLGGAYRPGPRVTVVHRDRTDRPAAGRYSVCYVNAFQSQPGRARDWGGLLLRDARGHLVEDAGWPGEYLVDTRRAAAVAALVGRWVRGCAATGFDAVELDNLDSFTRSRGLLRPRDNLRVLARLVTAGHAAGLAVAQKNTVELTAAARRAGTDFAVAEECQVYAECDGYAHAYGSRWVEVEYDAAAFRAACRLRGRTTAVVLRDRAVVPRGTSGYIWATC